MNAEEIIKLIIDNNEETYDIEYNLDKDIFGNFEIVVDYSSTGGDAFKVFFFKEHEVYIRQNGYYDSYESYSRFEDHDYDEVTPYTKIVTRFESTSERKAKLDKAK